MRVMVIVKATPDSEAGVMPTEQLFAEMGKYNEELVNAGIMVGGDGLKPSSAGVRVHFSGGQISSTDGPFAETKEQLGGYYLLNCENLDEAIQWAAKLPGAREGSIEVRPIWEFEG